MIDIPGEDITRKENENMNDSKKECPCCEKTFVSPVTGNALTEETHDSLFRPALKDSGATKKTDLMPHAEWLIRDELELGVDKLIQCSNCGYVYHMDRRPPYHYPTFCNVCGRNMIVGVKDK